MNQSPRTFLRPTTAMFAFVFVVTGAAYASTNASPVNEAAVAESAQPPSTAAIPSSSSYSPEMLESCRYVSDRAETFSEETRRRTKVACPSGYKVVSGSCWLPIGHYHFPWEPVIVATYPYENGDINDFPDSGELHEDIDGENGWVCEADRSHVEDTPTMIYAVVAEAFCCQ